MRAGRLKSFAGLSPARHGLVLQLCCSLIRWHSHGHKLRSETRTLTKTKPNALLRRFYYDALTHDERAVRYPIDLVSPHRVVIGADAPFDMGEEHPVEIINKLKGLSAKDREQIFSTTALRLIVKRV